MRSHSSGKCSALAIVLLFFFGCDTRPTHHQEQTDYILNVLSFRKAKDAQFAQSPASPLPEAAKRSFSGLHYYEIDPDWRFTLHLQRFASPDTVRIMTSGGTDRQAQKYGYFSLALHGRPDTLYVFKLLDIQDDHPGHMLIPFKDATSGKETYPGGRYLDLQENSGDDYSLDFNLAYNPLCAYGMQEYLCPLPPEENLLDFPVRAGEKNWQKP